MRLLILTQKVHEGDDVLGFFHRWIIEFSKHCEEVTVIALQVGTYDLPPNVRVFSLGKEAGAGKWKRLFTFWKLIWRERKHYDSVFVHMNPEYVTLGGPFWRLLRKKIVLFYTHRQDNPWLRNAEPIADVMLTASVKSFPFQSKKLFAIGHGIDVKKFECAEKKLSESEGIEILTVGRVSAIKNTHLLVEAVAKLRDKGHPVHATVVGGPITSADKSYLTRLYKQAADLKLGDAISFVGSVPNRDLPPYYCNADIVVNMTPTGGIDKTVLEAMAASRIPVVSNTAFEEYFGRYTTDLTFEEGNAEDLALKIERVLDRSDRRAVAEYLNKVARERCDVSHIVPVILSHLKK